MDLSSVSQRLAHLLHSRACRIVFAESCTAGLASATLATIPGISEWHCGSAVTYREPTKQVWLGVETEILRRCGAVSGEVAEAMAQGVLQRTPEAELAAAVTGHLGPNAPPELDAVIFTAVARRTDAPQPTVRVLRHVLAERTRHDRQQEATGLLLRHACEVLEDPNLEQLD